MSYTDFLRKMDNLKCQIERESTGTAEELAEKLCFSRRTLFNYFDILKEEGYNIKFSRYRNTYFFDKEESMVHKN
jgi:hypothetical protein